MLAAARIANACVWTLDQFVLVIFKRGNTFSWLFIYFILFVYLIYWLFFCYCYYHFQIPSHNKELSDRFKLYHRYFHCKIYIIAIQKKQIINKTRKIVSLLFVRGLYYIIVKAEQFYNLENCHRQISKKKTLTYRYILVERYTKKVILHRLQYSHFSYIRLL